MDSGQTISIEEVLQHHEWVRRTACALLGGDRDADDIVQETLLSALTSPPKPSGSLRGWLRQVTINHIRQRWRREGTYERVLSDVAALSVDDDSDEIVARVETELLVGRLVIELPPDQRRVVLLRYYEELSCAEIARRDGGSASTVRSRLRRALAALRGSLSAATHRSGRELALLLVPVAQSAPAFEPRGTSNAAAATSRVAAVAAVAVLLIAAGIVTSRALSPSDETTTSSLEATTPVHERSSRRRVSASRPASGDPVAREETAAETTGADAEIDPARRIRIRGEFSLASKTDDDAVRPWVFVVTAVGAGANSDLSPKATVEVDRSPFTADLVFEERVEDLAELRISAEHPDFLPITWTEPIAKGAERDLQLVHAPEPVRAALITGVVTDESGALAVGATVAFMEYADGSHMSRRTGLATVDADGRYRLRRTPGAGGMLVAYDEDSAVSHRRLTSEALAARDTFAHDFALVAGTRLRGRLRGPPGMPLDKIQIAFRGGPGRLWARGGTRDFWITGETLLSGSVFAYSDVKGEFTFSHGFLRPGQLEFQRMGVARDVFEKRPVEITQDTEDVLIEIEAVPLKITVTDGTRLLEMSGGAVYAPLGSQVIDLTATGSGRVWLRSGTRYKIEISKRGYGDRELTVDVPTVDIPEPIVVVLERKPADRSWWIELAPGGDASPPEIIGVGLLDHDSGFPLFVGRLVARREGLRYRVEGLPPGRFRVSLRHGTKWSEARSDYADVEIEIDTRRADPPSASVVFRRGGRILLEVRGDDGEFLSARPTVLTAAGDDTGARFMGGSFVQTRGASRSLGTAGVSEIDRVLVPGTYVVRVEANDYLTLEKVVQVSVGSTETLVFAMRRE